MQTSSYDKAIWCVAASGAVTAAGTLFTWERLVTNLGPINVVGTTITTGQVVFLTTALAVAATTIAVSRGWRVRLTGGVGLLAAIFIAGVAIVQTADFAHQGSHVRRSSGVVGVHIGIGLWVSDAAAIALVAAVTWALLWRQSATSSDDHTLELTDMDTDTDPDSNAVAAGIPTQRNVETQAAEAAALSETT